MMMSDTDRSFFSDFCSSQHENLQSGSRKSETELSKRNSTIDFSSLSGTNLKILQSKRYDDRTVIFIWKSSFSGKISY